MTASEQQPTWPPPVGARVTATGTCCGQTLAEIRFASTGDPDQHIVVPGCPNSVRFPHNPRLTFTWVEDGVEWQTSPEQPAAPGPCPIADCGWDAEGTLDDHLYEHDYNELRPTVVRLALETDQLRVAGVAAPVQPPADLRPFSAAEITTELTPLAFVIDHALRTTSVRLGDPADLTAALAVAVAAHLGPLVGDVPEQLVALRAEVRTLTAVCTSNREAYKGAVLDLLAAEDELAALREQLAAVNTALRAAGIEHPLGAAGVRDLAAMANGNREELAVAEQRVQAKECPLPPATCTQRQCIQAAPRPTA